MKDNKEMTLTLNLKGRNWTVSVEEIKTLIEEYLESKATGPKEGKWFKVDPKSINQQLFQEERSDEQQEMMRLIILEAFEMVKRYPQKYGKTFETYIPEKKWRRLPFSKLKWIAELIGDGMANWIEQGMEWAQRIHNGESWEKVCNTSDTLDWFRLIVWKDGEVKRIGGAKKDKELSAPCCISDLEYDEETLIYDAVPLVVRYVYNPI